jgi:hypothetical protein
MGILTPDVSILPASQQLLWDQLRPTPEDFVLYGGTALALRLGHRQSVDFDFFSSEPFQPADLVRTIGYLRVERIMQQSENTLSCEVGTAEGEVKISFFGGLSLRQVDAPDVVASHGIAVASLRDLFGTKCATVPQRNEIKDYLDIHALIDRAHMALSEGIACAGAIYGRQYNPLLTLQALSYFDDLPELLGGRVVSELLAAVKGVSLDELPTITASDRIGTRGHAK